MKTILHIAHQPSINTAAIAAAVHRGGSHPDFVTDIRFISQTPAQTLPEHVLAADALILGTTENLGYMSGALKDFFDRCYYPVLELKQGMPCGLWIRAGHDGTGTRRAIDSIMTGLRWQLVQPVLMMSGAWRPDFLEQAEQLGMAMAAGLDAGIF